MKSLYLDRRFHAANLEHTLDLGNTSAIEPGPWHYGADYVTVYFKADRTTLGSLLPKPFELGDGKCIAYTCEIISVADGNKGAVSEAPERTVYREAAFGIGCSFGGKPGVFFPVMWVDTEWSLLRGLVNGFPKRLADSIVVSRLHPMNPGLAPLGEGSRLSGYCVKGAQRRIWVRVTAERSGVPNDLVAFGVTYGMRKMPRTDPSQGAVSEAVEVLKSNSRWSDVWLGKGEVSLEPEIGRLEVLYGAIYKSGFTISGSKVLARV